MLEFLQGRASDRKLRLFVCACARLVWERLPPGDMREAVETGERLADGLATEEDRLRYVRSLYAMPVDAGRESGANWFSTRPREDVSAYFAAQLAVGRFVGKPLTTRSAWAESSRLTGPRQPALLREAFGNPFRP